MSDFTAGFAARQDAAARALHLAFSARTAGFAPRDMAPSVETPATPKHFSPQDPAPRHFSPADRETNPTEGWNPFDEAAPTVGGLDPIEAAHDAGYAEGFAAAEAASAQNRERDYALLESITNALKTAGQCDRDQFAQRMRQTVMHLVGQIVGEVGISPDMFAARITTATDLLADSAEAAMLHLHPDDVALLEGRLPHTVYPVSDQNVARGGFILESSTTIVEDGPESWLEQLGHAMDRVALPGTC